MSDDNGNVLNDLKGNDQSKLDKKQARKMVWRTRLSIGFTVIRTLLLLFLLYILYMIPVNIYYDMSGKQAGFERSVTTLVETRYPGVEVSQEGGIGAEINPLLTQSASLKLYRNVGEWDVVLGEVEAKKRLFGDVHVTMDIDSKYLNGNDFKDFAIPPKLLGRDYTNIETGNKDMLKKQLQKIDDGHVAQVQFSVKEAMKPKALLEKLQTYDVRTFRMPIYGGELTEFDINYHRGGQITFAQSLLLKPQTVYDSNNRVSSSRSALHEDTLKKTVDRFYKNIEWLMENSNYNGRDIDQKRIDYIRENGMHVYGAVVTGPIREIEKLMKEDAFYQFRLGGIEVWNWYER
ncbi:anti-sigma factor [Lentibacillus halophilus]|uniref:Anti-sigma factor n=1 Tax=Lentibacillus halophilus TaxID=295065 RepID=A0ABP3JA15_9BACI